MDTMSDDEGTGEALEPQEMIERLLADEAPDAADDDADVGEELVEAEAQDDEAEPEPEGEEEEAEIEGEESEPKEPPPIDIDGENYTVEEVKRALTAARNTEAVAAEFERRNEEAGKQYAAAMTELQAIAERLQTPLSELPTAVDWAALAKEHGPEAALNLRRQYDELQHQHQQRAADLEAIASANAQRRDEAKRREAQQVIAEMPQLADDAYRNQIAEFAVSLGATEQEMQDLTSPVMWRILNAAYQHHDGQRRLAVAKKQATTTAAPKATRPSARSTPNEANRRKYLSAMRRLQKSGEPDDAQAALEARLMD